MYDNVLADVESVFASEAWTVNNIEVYPDNYQGDINTESEFCRLNVLPSNSSINVYGGNKILEGMVAVKIFVKAGEGQSRVMAISDILDTVLQNKRLINGTELATSYLNVEGLDPSNKSLYSALYIIPFKIYGEH
jgi:hypothetical protein